MILKSGYSLNLIKENIETLKQSVDEQTAIEIAVSYARGVFKRERPDTTAFPKHLTPGMVRKSLGGEVNE